MMPPDKISTNTKVGVVVIGRNEGERLKICLESVIECAAAVVYVDSGSTDNSLELANKLGIGIVELDITIPFTAARARNEGFNKLYKDNPDLNYIQFVDGDCEIRENWVQQAAEFLEKNSNVAVVCGRRRERFPDNSIYNSLCDIEWNTVIGEAKACGGDALMRASVFQQVSGFDSNVIAGEEPELCVRIRQEGWKIWRLELEMTLHDADIRYFSQWWKRNVRAGYAYSLGAAMHGKDPELHRIREVKRIRLWSLYIPITILAASLLNTYYLLGFLIYPVQVIRVKIKNAHVYKHGWLYALFVTLGKFPEMQGQLKFMFNRLMNKKSSIIEYKG